MEKLKQIIDAVSSDPEPPKSKIKSQSGKKIEEWINFIQYNASKNEMRSVSDEFDLEDSDTLSFQQLEIDISLAIDNFNIEWLEVFVQENDGLYKLLEFMEETLSIDKVYFEITDTIQLISCLSCVKLMLDSEIIRKLFYQLWEANCNHKYENIFAKILYKVGEEREIPILHTAAKCKNCPDFFKID